jgi:high-affinity K+ transport system ATPase subunit B
MNSGRTNAMNTQEAIHTLEEKKQWVPRACEGLSIEETGEVATLLHPQTGRIFVINAIAQRMIELSDGQTNVGEIVRMICQEFAGATEERVIADIDRFYTKATQKGLILWR